MTDSERINAAVRRWNKTGDFGMPLEELIELQLELDESGDTVRFGDATWEHLERRARFLERQLRPATRGDTRSDSCGPAEAVPAASRNLFCTPPTLFFSDSARKDRMMTNHPDSAQFAAAGRVFGLAMVRNCRAGTQEYPPADLEALCVAAPPAFVAGVIAELLGEAR